MSIAFALVTGFARCHEQTWIPRPPLCSCTPPRYKTHICSSTRLRNTADIIFALTVHSKAMTVSSAVTTTCCLRAHGQSTSWWWQQRFHRISWRRTQRPKESCWLAVGIKCSGCYFAQLCTDIAPVWPVHGGDSSMPAAPPQRTPTVTMRAKPTIILLANTMTPLHGGSRQRWQGCIARPGRVTCHVLIPSIAGTLPRQGRLP